MCLVDDRGECRVLHDVAGDEEADQLGGGEYCSGPAGPVQYEDAGQAQFREQSGGVQSLVVQAHGGERFDQVAGAHRRISFVAGACAPAPRWAGTV